MPKRLAIVATIWRYLSHAQHLGDRFLVGYPRGDRWHRPDTQVVSLYVDQRPPGDQSEERAREFGFRVYPTIADALRCGGPRLAVDGVLIIGEHGSYPRSEKGQTLYPRYEFFRQVADVFESDGRAVPVYNDKHLSYRFDRAREMVETARRLEFPLLAGSSLPVTWRVPDLDLPYGCDLDEALQVGVGSSDAMDYHALEAMQCMVERRRGGETGVRSVQLLEGNAVWEAGRAGKWSRELLAAALSRSDTVQGMSQTDGRPQDLMSGGLLERLVPRPAAYLVERKDGLRTTLLMLNGAVRDYTFAARLKGERQIRSTQFLLTLTPNVTYSACLVAGIEEMLVTGRAPYPAERTMIVCGILESCLDSRMAGGRRLETPHLDVRYRGPRRSRYGESLLRA